MKKKNIFFYFFYGGGGGEVGLGGQGRCEQRSGFFLKNKKNVGGGGQVRGRGLGLGGGGRGGWLGVSGWMLMKN